MEAVNSFTRCWSKRKKKAYLEEQARKGKEKFDSDPFALRGVDGGGR